MKIRMLQPGFYVQPHIRQASLQKFQRAKAKGAELTPATQGMLVALDYYQPERFATKSARDLACGPTAHPDVRYFPVGRAELIASGTKMDEVSCGHSIDDPHFERIVSPMLDQAAKHLMEQIFDSFDQQTGIIAETVLTIARARYSLSVNSSPGGWLNFDVQYLCVFEQIEPEVMDRTSKFLGERLRLCLSAPPPNAKLN